MIVIHEIRLNTSEHSIEYPNEEYEIVLHQLKRRNVPYDESLTSDGFDGYPGTDKLKTLYWNQISVYIRSCDKDNFDVIIRLYNDIDDYKKHAHTYWAKTKAAAYQDVFSATLMDAYSRGTISPAWLWYRFRNALKDGERFIRRRLKRKNS